MKASARPFFCLMYSGFFPLPPIPIRPTRLRFFPAGKPRSNVPTVMGILTGTSAISQRFRVTDLAACFFIPPPIVPENIFPTRRTNNCPLTWSPPERTPSSSAGPLRIFDSPHLSFAVFHLPTQPFFSHGPVSPAAPRCCFSAPLLAVFGTRPVQRPPGAVVPPYMDWTICRPDFGAGDSEGHLDELPTDIPPVYEFHADRALTNVQRNGIKTATLCKCPK